MTGQWGSRRGILLGALCIILGLVAGAGLGLLLSQGIKFPCRSSAALARLGSDSREEYAVLVAAKYSLDQDLERARAQLERLGVPNPNLWIAALLDSSLDGGRDPEEMHALAQLAWEMGVDSPAVLAYQATTMALAPSDTPPPTATRAPSITASQTASPTAAPVDTATPVPTDSTLPADTATAEPTAVPPTDMVSTDTPIPPTPTTQPSETPIPPTPTAPPPTAAPPTVAAPTATPAAEWTWTARLVGPGEDAQTCADGQKLIRVTVLDAAGNQIPGQWVHEQYTGQYRVTGHKGDDPFWGPGEAEFSQLNGGLLCIATGEGGSCESDLTRDLPCYAPPPVDDLWAAGYCQCCEPDITKERCQELRDAGQCIWYSHYAWRVEFRRSW
jgi:hypothetical protein